MGQLFDATHGIRDLPYSPPASRNTNFSLQRKCCFCLWNMTDDSFTSESFSSGHREDKTAAAQSQGDQCRVGAVLAFRNTLP